MAVTGVNNMLNTYKVMDNSRTKSAPSPAPNKDAVNNPETENIKKSAARNNTVNSTNTDNRNITNNNNTPKVQTTANMETVQKDQAQATRQLNNIQKLPNGMDAVQQAVIQGYKGVNRLA
jgi:hypothetical protein